MRWLTVGAAVVVCLAAACSMQTHSSIDAQADIPADVVDTGVCAQCRADQFCVARFDGQCGASIGCVVRTVDCVNNVCSPACEAAYCPQPYQCQNRAACGGEPPGVFTCYGP
jgi:hypothetical protein